MSQMEYQGWHKLAKNNETDLNYSHILQKIQKLGFKRIFENILLKRMKRLELSTLSLARRCSTTELHPQAPSRNKPRRRVDHALPRCRWSIQMTLDRKRCSRRRTRLKRLTPKEPLSQPELGPAPINSFLMWQLRCASKQAFASTTSQHAIAHEERPSRAQPSNS